MTERNSSYSKTHTYTIDWNGKAVFCKQNLSREAWQKYLIPDLPYEAARVNMADSSSGRFGLPISWLKPLAATEAINRIIYGKRWLTQSEYRDMPVFHSAIFCEINGERADYNELPLPLRRKIATDIVMNDSESGHFTLRVRDSNY